MIKISKAIMLAVLVLAFASAAFATTSRVLSLANAAPYMNDDSDVFRWYGTLSSYNNMVMAEGGQASIGGHVGDRRGPSLGDRVHDEFSAETQPRLVSRRRDDSVLVVCRPEERRENEMASTRSERRDKISALSSTT